MCTTKTELGNGKKLYKKGQHYIANVLTSSYIVVTHSNTGLFSMKTLLCETDNFFLAITIESWTK